MKIILLKLTIVFAFFVLSACAGISVRVPYAKVQSPEVKTKKFQKSINAIEATSVADYEISDDASERPFVEDEFNFFKGSKLSTNVGFDMQLFDRFEVGIGLGGIKDWRLKYQLMGETKENSRPQNQSLAIYANIMSTYSYNQGDQNGESGPGGYDWSSYVEGATSSLGLSYGYKIRDDVLFYMGLAIGNSKTSGEVVHEASDDLSSPGADYDITERSGRTQTIASGFEVGQEWQSNIAINYSQLTLDDISKKDLYLTYTLTYNFDSASGAAGQVNTQVGTNVEPKSSWTGSDFLALGSSYLFGFGSGQAIQGRWENSGKYFAVADGSAAVLLISSLTNCLEGSSCGYSSGTMVGALIFAISRIWQFVDVFIDANKTIPPQQPTVLLYPNGRETVFALSKTF